MSRVVEPYRRACDYLAGGVSASTRFNRAIGHAMLFERAEGCRVWDLDGREYIDLCCSHGATLLGHGDPQVRAAVLDVLQRGAACSYENELHTELAGLLRRTIPCCQRVRFTGSGTEATRHCIRLLGRLPSEMGYQPTLADDLAVLEERIASVNGAAITSVQAVYVPADDLTDPAVAQTFAHLDASIVLSRELAAQGLYPAIDPLVSTSRLIDPDHLGRRHYDVALQVKETIERYRDLQDIISMLGLEELSAEDQRMVRRARRLERFLTQPLFVTEAFTGHTGRRVPLEKTIAGCEAILAGRYDDRDEGQLYMIGGLEEVGG